jgi:hypothetical protein
MPNLQQIRFATFAKSNCAFGLAAIHYSIFVLMSIISLAIGVLHRSFPKLYLCDVSIPFWLIVFGTINLVINALALIMLISFRVDWAASEILYNSVIYFRSHHAQYYVDTLRYQLLAGATV